MFFGVAVSCMALPTITVAGDGVTSTATTGSGEIVTVAVRFRLS
jgi:hypothetical protein